jgi:lipopolysaccharide transport system ATP-binding protein
MSTPVIVVENLSKLYRLGEVGTGSLAHDVNRWWHGIRGKDDPYSQVGQLNDRTKKAESEWVYALKDINFEVKQGEALGIIGRNGAGKSTLLKILSRVTAPTSGQVRVKGRIAALLEVGTGFHPELTGKENIFLNGAILGMTKAEIRSKFDQIIDFSGCEAYLDTPVKRYSSGMQVRLAFAVAAHLEPEILIVDEVLAVGDSEFQKKCIGRMSEVTGEGRTILFVSHNLVAVTKLCKTAILLQNGKIEQRGFVDSVAEQYLSHPTLSSLKHTVALPEQSSLHSIWVEQATILRNGKPDCCFETGDKISLEISFSSLKPVSKPVLGYLIRSATGENVVCANNQFLPSPEFDLGVREGVIKCELEQVPLVAGIYTISLWLCIQPNDQFYIEEVLHFSVEHKNIWGTDGIPPPNLAKLWWPTRFTLSH